MRTTACLLPLFALSAAPVHAQTETPVLDAVPAARGDWSYRADARGSVALFSDGGMPVASVRCDRQARRVQIARAGRVGSQGAQMTIRTSFGPLSWPAQDSAAAGRDGSSAFVGAWRSPADIGLDRIAYSRGRFAVEVPGMAPLVLPVWAEPIRVIEDCRA